MDLWRDVVVERRSCIVVDLYIGVELYRCGVVELLSCIVVDTVCCVFVVVLSC